MHEQSQHGHAPYGVPQDGATAPWPTPHQGAYVPGPAPAQQSPMQYQYANGMVVPGASSQQHQLSAHDGTIGIAMPADHTDPTMLPQLGGAPAPVASAQPQAWAFPTPQGLQLVQPGEQQQLIAGTAPAIPGAPVAAVAMPQSGGPTRRRMRWETIIPAAAITLFIAAAALFISDFDRITGRDVAKEASRASAAAAAADESTDGKAGEQDAVIQQVNTLVGKGQFEDAANLIHPLLDAPSPDPKLVELHDRIDAAAEKNASLLATVAKQRRAGSWSDLQVTIAELEQLRPLTPSLTKLKTTATRNASIDRALKRATALGKQGRTTEAVKVLNAAIAKTPNKRLTALRTKLRGTQGARGGGDGSGAGAAGAPTTAPKAAAPPASGGARPTKRPAATNETKPPANAPAGGRPDVPNVPNPVGPANGGAAAVGGGGGSNCMVHDGVEHCM